MAEIKTANYVRKTIANVGGIADDATSVTLNAVTGLPTLTAGDWFYLVLVRLSDMAVEIVKVTAVNTTTKACTIVRSQDGTGPYAFAQNDRAELWVTSGTLSDIIAMLRAEIAAAVSFGNITYGSILVGGSTEEPTELVAKGDKKILIGNGATLTSVDVTGDVTITNLGVTAIGATKVTNAMLAGSIAHAKLAALTTGSILIGVADVATALAIGTTPNQILFVNAGGTTAEWATLGAAGDVTLSGKTLSIGAGVVTNTMLAVGLPQIAEVTIPYANVNALSATPYTLVAGTSGKALEFLGAIISHQYSAHEFAASRLGVFYESTTTFNVTNTLSSWTPTGLLTATSNTHSCVSAWDSGGLGRLITAAKGLVLVAENNPTHADARGDLLVKLCYRQVTVS